MMPSSFTHEHAFDGLCADGPGSATPVASASARSPAIQLGGLDPEVGNVNAAMTKRASTAG
jgi:hypothetical protein